MHLHLAYAAAKKRQSPETGFVHLGDRVSLYENFCFVYALLAQKKVETVQEAKNLVTRLIAFQSPEGNFPVNLHDFPRCYDLYQGLKIAPLLLRMHHLGAECTELVQSCLQRLLTFYQNRDLPSMWKFRYQVCQGLKPTPPEPTNIWEHWISLQFLQTPTNEYSGLCLPIDQPIAQNQFEPAPGLIDWVSAPEYSERLRKDHPTQIQLAAIDKVETKLEHSPILLQEPFQLYWQDESLHSLVGPGLNIQLPTEIAFNRDDLFEVAFYCDAKCQVLIDGQKGTVFKLGEPVQIITPSLKVTLRFEGEGDFCGHIFRSNRPNQIDETDSYDWKIGLRTLRRSPNCMITVNYTIYQK